MKMSGIASAPFSGPQQKEQPPFQSPSHPPFIEFCKSADWIGSQQILITNILK